jgi:hypothetical protein
MSLGWYNTDLLSYWIVDRNVSSCKVEEDDTSGPEWTQINFSEQSLIENHCFKSHIPAMHFIKFCCEKLMKVK